MLPTAHGGANWGGAAVNPETNRLFVNSTDIPMILKLTDLKKIRAANQLNPGILYRTYCSNCHGVDKRGSGLGPDLTGRAKKYKGTQIASILQKGAPPMPSFAFLSQEQIAAIVAYFKLQLAWTLIVFVVALVSGFAAQIWFIAGLKGPGKGT